jgi:BRCT domain type II-containing protein
MIESFGGKVTSAVSGKTNFLVVGKEPGISKVSKAKARGLPLVDVKTLSEHIHSNNGIEQLKEAPAPAIKSWSAGYPKNFIEY